MSNEKFIGKTRTNERKAERPVRYLRPKDSFITEYLELPETIHLPVDTEVTEELVDTLVEIHRNNVNRYEVLQGYYKGQAKILERTKRPNQSNNKLVLDYPSYIVDMLLGLFVGKPVTYAVEDEHVGDLEQIQEILDFNDEQDENTEIAKMAGINGRAYEIVYLDEEGQIRFNEVDPQHICFVYDDRINPEPLFALYIRDDSSVDSLKSKDKDQIVTVYTKDKELEFKGSSNEFKLIEERPNYFGQVNVIEILNNDEGIGDFERVLTLIDEMNLLNSDTANDFEEFTDAILVLYGVLATDSDDIDQLMIDRVLKLSGDNQGAEWLIKDINDSALKNYKDDLDKYIHKFSKVPNMGDEAFASNISGEAMKFKLFGTDQIISQKQRKFKTALLKRLELIISVLNIKGSSGIDHTDIDVSFSDNKPINELDNVKMVKEMLDTGVSRQFALSKLRDLDDVHEEIRRQDEEKGGYYDLLFARDDISEMAKIREEVEETSKGPRQEGI